TTTITLRPSSVTKGAAIADRAPVPNASSPLTRIARPVASARRQSGCRRTPVAASGAIPIVAMARARRRSSPPSSSNPSSASKTSQSSSMNRRPRLDSSLAALTSPMIAARRAASTKRRRRDRSAAPPCTAEAGKSSAERDRDDCMVAVSLGAPEPRHLTMRVEAHDRRRRAPESRYDRPDLLGDPLLEGPPPARAVEDDRRLWISPTEAADGRADRSRAAGQELLEVELGEFDHGALRNSGSEDDRPLAGPPDHVAQPEVAVQLGLGDRMRDRHRLELLVVEGHPHEAELLQVDLLGRATVDLLDELSL